MGQLRGAAAPTSAVPMSKDLLAALAALAECSAQLEHEPLRGTMGHATCSLLALIEGRCRESVEFLLRGLGSKGEGGDVQFDKLWTLHVMGQRSEVTKRWILELGGINAIADVMASHPGHEELLHEGAWLVHDLRGPEGLGDLLHHSSHAVQAAAAWAIYDLAKDYLGSGDDPSDGGWPEAPKLLVALTEVLRTDSGDLAALQVRWACCAALRRIVEGQPGRGRLFLMHRGGEALSKSICAVVAVGNAGASLLTSCSQLVTALVDGSDQVGQQLRQLGVLEALVGCAVTSSGKAYSEAIWAIGHLGGVAVVLETIRQSGGASSPAVGLAVLAEVAWHPSEESLTQYPQAAPQLLAAARACESSGASPEDTAYAVKALGGVLHSLAPHVAPGAWQVADDGVVLLMEAVTPQRPEAVVQAAAESLGRIAVDAPAWRLPLRRALEALSSRLRTPSEGDRRLQKYLFWAAAAIAGLPAVLYEMRSQQQSPTVQDAALCSVIDLLDGDLDGEYSLRGLEEASKEEHGSYVPEATAVVVEAMRLHRAFLPVQYRGSHALGLLSGQLPVGTDLPREAVDAVLSALWRHPMDANVAAGSCSALRAFLEPRRGHDPRSNAAAIEGVVMRAAALLRERDVEPCVRQVLEHFGGSATSASAELLEDAAYVLGVISSVSEVLQLLVSSQSRMGPLRASGLKALFELGRCFPGLFAPPVSVDVTVAIDTLVQGEVGGTQEVELRRHAELLRGLLQHIS